MKTISLCSKHICLYSYYERSKFSPLAVTHAVAIALLHTHDGMVCRHPSINSD